MAAEHRVVVHPAALDERSALAAVERGSIDAAIEKLRAMGRSLPAPHQRDVPGVSSDIRALQPRAGHRPTVVAFYGQVGETFIVLGIGPAEAVDPAGFRRASNRAVQRLAELETS